MTQILKFTTNWTGFVGAPGYTNMYVRDFSSGDVDQAMADAFITKLDAFWDAIVGVLPTAVSVVVDPAVEIIETETGTLQGFLTVAADTTRVGTGAGTYAAPTGAVVNWYTNFVRNGRRLKGKTFLVPMVGSAFESNGSIGATPLATLRTAATNLVNTATAGDLGVWGRPSTPGATDGVWAVAQTAIVPDMAAVLRSRRN